MSKDQPSTNGSISEGIELMLGDTGASLSSALLSFSLLLRVSSFDTLSKTLGLTLGVLELLPKKLLALLRGLWSSILSGSFEDIALVDERRDNAVGPVMIAESYYKKRSEMYTLDPMGAAVVKYIDPGGWSLDISLQNTLYPITLHAFEISRSSERNISCYKDQEKTVWLGPVLAESIMVIALHKQWSFTQLTQSYTLLGQETILSWQIWRTFQTSFQPC